MEDLACVETTDLGIVEGRPLLATIDISDDRGAVGWAAENVTQLERLLLENGALIVRGLGIRDASTLNAVLEKLFRNDLLDYVYRSTPRTQLHNRIYTASEYHAGETILLHNENAYTNRWPLNIAFCCIQAPESGGQTPIADSRQVFRDIRADIVAEFERKGVMYVRNYGSIDLPWSEVFQTSEKKAVEVYCAENDIEVEWLPNNGLRTKQRLPGIRKHPTTSELVWFNAAHMFHVSSLAQNVRNAMLSLVGEENLPRNVYYGDGSTIEGDVFDNIRSAYRENKITFNWREGDLLLLDNMLFAHGREPFTGPRRVLAGMAHSSDRIAEPSSP